MGLLNQWHYTLVNKLACKETAPTLLQGKFSLRTSGWYFKSFWFIFKAFGLSIIITDGSWDRLKVTHSMSHTPWSCQGAVFGWGLVPEGVWCSSCLPSVCTDSLTCHPMLCWADSESDEGKKKKKRKKKVSKKPLNIKLKQKYRG